MLERLESALALTLFTSLSPAVLGAAPAAPDEAAPGHRLTRLAYPGNARVATLSTGELVTFDGLHVSLARPASPFRPDRDSRARVLAELPAFGFPSFVLVDPCEEFAVVGENSSGGIHRVHLVTGERVHLTDLAFNYDAAFETPDSLVVSAATCGFGCGNELHRLDLRTGATTLLAAVGGASGPVAVGPSGDLYYGTISGLFPPPAGSSDVLVWDAALLTGNPPVTEADANVVGSGFDGAADLALDPLLGDLYLAVNVFPSVNELRFVNGSAATSPVLVTGEPGGNIAGLEFVPGDGVARFLPFQPAGQGGLLRYHTTDFGARFERHALVTQRPVATLVELAPGLVELTVEGGPPLGRVLVYYGPRALYSPAERAVRRPGTVAPLFTGLHLSTALLDRSGVLMLDASGTATKSYLDPGGLIHGLAVQGLIVEGAELLGTTTTALL